jgi:hypothetical protein
MVTPQQCTKMTEKEAQEFKALEAHIDAELQAKFLPGQTLTIAVGDASGRLIRRVKELYGTHWKVEYNSDQRDGAWFSFRVLAEGSEGADYFERR